MAAAGVPLQHSTLIPAAQRLHSSTHQLRREGQPRHRATPVTALLDQDPHRGSEQKPSPSQRFQADLFLFSGPTDVMGLLFSFFLVQLTAADAQFSEIIPPLQFKLSSVLFYLPIKRLVLQQHSKNNYFLQHYKYLVIKKTKQKKKVFLCSLGQRGKFCPTASSEFLLHKKIHIKVHIISPKHARQGFTKGKAYVLSYGITHAV